MKLAKTVWAGIIGLLLVDDRIKEKEREIRELAKSNSDIAVHARKTLERSLDELISLANRLDAPSNDDRRHNY